MLTEIVDRLMSVVNSILKIKQGKPYWIEISTKEPFCIYYFGPFENSAEAKEMQHGYIQDLIEEKAAGISVTIKRCLPTRLTIMEEEFPVG
jgi:hypothetical protein